MKQYKTYEDVQRDLKLLNLERHIAWENMKLQKNKIGDELQPKQWMVTVYKVVQKYGVYILMRRLLR